MNSVPSQDASFYDVIVIGGALSGAATATLLLRQNSGLRVLIVEKSAQLTRRVGQATVEVSAFFMGRVLGLTRYLNESHLVKQGLRFWFTNDEVKSLDEASELGGHYQVRLPSYQLDRATFDEEVLRRTCAAGAELLRPASVTQVGLFPGGEQTVTISRGEKTETIRARWIVDASGVAALLARKEGWWRQNIEHPTAAAWSRWKGVKDWDSYELAATSAAELITAQRRGDLLAQRLECYNRDFALSYRSWFESVYKDKYEYLGEWDLMSLAFQLDLGLYYLGIVSQPFRVGVKALLSPPFTTSLSRPVFHLIRTYNRRFAQIARRRRRMNALGRANRGRRCLIKGFTLSRSDIRLLVAPLFKWGWLELKEGWRSWWQPREDKALVRIAVMREQRQGRKRRADGSAQRSTR